MGNRGGGCPRKFYWTQVAKIKKLLDRYVKESTQNVDLSKYLALCEQLGQEPDPDKMPLEASAFPYEVQVAFFVFDLLPDKWDGMSGMYLGKDWSSANFLIKTYNIEDVPIVVYFAKLYENILVSQRSEELARKQKQQQQQARNKAKLGG